MKKAKPIRAQYPGTCPHCGHEYHAGTRILPIPGTRRWGHSDCAYQDLMPTRHVFQAASPTPQSRTAGILSAILSGTS